MKFKKAHIDEEVGVQMASMIDIVFLLLIFFVVSSQLKELEIEKEVTLPIADFSQKKESEGFLEIQVNVLPNNMIKVGESIIEIDKLPEELAKLTKITSGKDKKIIIRGDKKAQYGRVMRIMNSCAAANIWNVSFATFKEEQKN
jgi:biopolymer transport protein ExbD